MLPPKHEGGGALQGEQKGKHAGGPKLDRQRGDRTAGEPDFPPGLIFGAPGSLSTGSTSLEQLIQQSHHLQSFLFPGPVHIPCPFLRTDTAAVLASAFSWYRWPRRAQGGGLGGRVLTGAERQSKRRWPVCRTQPCLHLARGLSDHGGLASEVSFQLIPPGPALFSCPHPTYFLDFSIVCHSPASVLESRPYCGL